MTTTEPHNPHTFFYEQAARDANPAFADKAPFSWKVVRRSPGANIIEIGFADSTSTFKSGPRKGTIKYIKPFTNLIVTQAEALEAEKRWLGAGHVCPHCLDKGELFKRWSVWDGTEYKPCSCGQPIVDAPIHEAEARLRAMAIPIFGGDKEKVSTWLSTYSEAFKDRPIDFLRTDVVAAEATLVAELNRLKALPMGTL